MKRCPSNKPAPRVMRGGWGLPDELAAASYFQRLSGSNRRLIAERHGAGKLDPPPRPSEGQRGRKFLYL